MKTYIQYILLFMLSFSSLYAQDENTGQCWKAGRPDGHAPISIMGDHTHSQGEGMFSYRFIHINMDGMRDGKNSPSTEEVTCSKPSNFLASPTDMQINMHMLGVMIAPNDRLALMGTPPILALSMDHPTRAGVWVFKPAQEALGIFT